MNKLIFNEKRYIEDVINNHKNADVQLFQLAQLIAIYHYQEGCTDKAVLADIVNKELEGFNFADYYYERYYKIIGEIVNSVIKYDMTLKNVTEVPVYKTEYDIISNCGDIKHQKLLLALYVMARWSGDSGWTSSRCKIKYIKKSANLNCTNAELDSIFYDLINDGYIKKTRKVGKYCYQMLNFNEDKNEDVAIVFDSFDDLGNKFIASKDTSRITCSVCGRLVKRTSPRMKYCKKCAEIKKRENNKKIQQRRRKS